MCLQGAEFETENEGKIFFFSVRQKGSEVATKTRNRIRTRKRIRNRNQNKKHRIAKCSHEMIQKLSKQHTQIVFSILFLFFYCYISVIYLFILCFHVFFFEVSCVPFVPQSLWVPFPSVSPVLSVMLFISSSHTCFKYSLVSVFSTCNHSSQRT